MSNQGKTETFALSSNDIVQLLIKEYGFPEDCILLRFERPLNQDAWIVYLWSSKFKEHRDLDTLPIMRLAPGYKYE